ncbi:unnamed protein product, partial [Hymenolepis diminuta]
KTCKRWFLSFNTDDISLKDEPRAGCSRKLNSVQLQVAIDENSTCNTRELSKTFNIAHRKTIYREMKRCHCESLKGWQMGSTWEVGFIRNQIPTACDLLSFTAST